MSIAQVQEILKGNFTDKADREYWEMKLKELQRKEANNTENAKYFKKLAVYDR